MHLISSEERNYRSDLKNKKGKIFLLFLVRIPSELCISEQIMGLIQHH